MGIDPISDGIFSYAHSPAGRPLAVSDGTGNWLAGTNRHGDLTHLFDPTGTVADSTLYDPFGEPIGTTGGVDPTIGYQSDYTDPTSAHVWMGARWYNPGTATFLSSRSSGSGCLPGDRAVPRRFGLLTSVRGTEDQRRII